MAQAPDMARSKIAAAIEEGLRMIADRFRGQDRLSLEACL